MLPGLLVLLPTVSCAVVATPITGVRFHASFDRWVTADRAAGGRLPKPGARLALAAGKLGQALQLDGAGYLEFPAGDSYPGPVGTVALWYQPAQWGARTYDSIFGFSDNNVNAFHFERSHPDGRLRWVIGGPDTADGAKTQSLWSKQPLPDGQWVHVAAVWDGAKRRAFYINGELAGALDGPGPVPAKPASILLGCGFGRLQRAAFGRLDEVVILDHAATPDEVRALMAGLTPEGAMVDLSNRRVRVSVDRARAEVTVASATSDRPTVLGPARAGARIDGRDRVCDRLGKAQPAAPIAGALGPADHRVFAGAADADGVAMAYHVQVPREQPVALLWVELRHGGTKPVVVESLDVLRADREAVMLPVPAERLNVFLDNGGLVGSRTHRLAAANARHTAMGAMVLAEPHGGWAGSFSFTSFRECAPTTLLGCDAQAQPQSLRATCGYPGGRRLAPGDTMASEVLAVALHSDGHTALSAWADQVMAVNELKPPRHCPSGWNSWYAYRLTITDEIVKQNARLVKERFAPLGVTNIQIDHGWQDRDIVGHWVPNTRFPRGLNPLQQELAQMGLSFGLWTAVTQVSEHAPLAKERPDVLFHDAQGAPFVTDAKWYWVPHGRCFTLDPTHPDGYAAYRRFGEAVRSYGCGYLKNDFQTPVMRTDVRTHTGQLGVPVYRAAMRALREGMGPDMAYHACNAPLNVVAGLCDVAWVHRDIGNPRGDWGELRRFAGEFAARAHVSGKFYWSDPDYVQIGQGTPNENQVRLALCALGGGPAFLGDRLPDLPEEKLRQLTCCFPSIGRPAQPVDLFAREDYPRLWALPVSTTWGRWLVLGVFNLDDTDERVELSWRELGLDPTVPVTLFDFFAARAVGEVSCRLPGDDLDLKLTIPVPAHSVRVLRLTPREERPYVIGTDLHLTGGGVELPQVKWDEATQTLSGTARRAPGLSGRIFVAVPRGYRAEGLSASDGVLAVPVKFAKVEEAWAVRFTR